MLLVYSLQTMGSKGLSRKRSLAMTKRPASTQKTLVEFVIRHNTFYKQKIKVIIIAQRRETLVHLAQACQQPALGPQERLCPSLG